MNEVIEILVSLMCPGTAAYECQRFLAGYDNTIVQLLWFAFYPVVFILLFTFILAYSVTEHTNKKFMTVIGVGIIMMIIIQGWWSIVLMVSKIWWFSLLILGGFYVFTHKMGMRRQGGSVGERQSSSIAGFVRSQIRGELTGNRKDLIKDIENQIAVLRRIQDDLRYARSKHADPKGIADIYREYEAARHRAYELIEKLREVDSYKGVHIRGDATHMKNTIEGLVKHIDSDFGRSGLSRN